MNNLITAVTAELTFPYSVTDTCHVWLFQEENDIPSCDLSGFIRPSPVIVASPLSTFYRSSPEDGPIIPETQVINQSEDFNRS